MSDKKSEEKSDEKIAPLVAGAARVGVAAAKNPAVRGAVSGAVSGMMAKKSFDTAWDSITKAKFKGYTRSNISERPYRQAEHRVWDISRKVKRERTKKRYARNKSRGVVRPAMRRQLGSGGKRASTKR